MLLIGTHATWDWASIALPTWWGGNSRDSPPALNSFLFYSPWHILYKQASGDTAHHLGNTQEGESTDGCDGNTKIKWAYSFLDLKNEYNVPCYLPTSPQASSLVYTLRRGCPWDTQKADQVEKIKAFFSFLSQELKWGESLCTSCFTKAAKRWLWPRADFLSFYIQKMEVPISLIIALSP